MKKSIVLPYNAQSIAMVIAMSNEDPTVIIKKINEASQDAYAQKVQKMSMDILGYDQEMWDAMKKRITQISEEIGNDTTIEYKERTIKLYGWIQANKHYTISIPYGESNDTYGYASTIETIIHQPHLYFKMLSFD